MKKSQICTPEEVHLIEKTRAYVEESLRGETTGHDIHHALRVEKMALHIAAKEGGNPLIVILAALLHDIADWKFHDGNIKLSSRLAEDWLSKWKLPKKSICHICDIIYRISYKGSGVATPMKTLEGKIVQDADRLDAIGAIGIARAFAYGGANSRPLYDPSESPVQHKNFTAYKNSKSHTINHFYEKLLLLKNRMWTDTAKNIARNRHCFMEKFLKEFYREWEGKK